MPDQEPIIIVGSDGTEHEFPAGFDPKRAAQIVRSQEGGNGYLAEGLRGAKVTGPMSFTDKALGLLPAAGGLLGGVVGSAAGVPGAIGGAALGGAAGEGYRQLINRIRAVPWAPQSSGEAAKKIAVAGAEQGAAEGLGQGGAKVARLAARGLMDAAIRPAPTVGEEFGDIAQTAIRERLPVGSVLGSKPGSQQARALRKASAANTDRLLAEAEASGHTVDPVAATSPNVSALRQELAKQPLADADEMALNRYDREFVARHGADVTPREAYAMKRSAQAVARPIFKAQRTTGSVTADRAMEGRYNEAIARGLEADLDRIPKVSASDDRTRALIGATRAIRRAENRRLPIVAQLGAATAGGVGAGLTGDSTSDRIRNALIGAAAARTLMSPALMSRGGLVLTNPLVQMLIEQIPRAGTAVEGWTDPEREALLSALGQ